MTRIIIAFVLLGTIAATACGARPNPADRDGSLPSSEDVATVTPDRPAPPPPDVAMTVDAGNPSPDAVVDAATPTTDAPPPPEDRPVVVADATPDGGARFDQAIMDVLRSHGLQVEGSTLSPERPVWRELSDGTVSVTISAEFATEIGCGHTQGICAGTGCDFPEATATTGRCRWSNFHPSMRQFDSRGGDGLATVVNLVR